MTGFLGRLAHRAVLPPARAPVAAPAIEPRRPARFEGVTSELDSANDILVEQQSWATAEPAVVKPSPGDPGIHSAELRDEIREAPHVLPEQGILNEAEPLRSRIEERRTATPADVEIERRTNTTQSTESAPMKPLAPVPASEPLVAEPWASTPAREKRHESPTAASRRLELVIDRQYAEHGPLEREQVAVVSSEAVESPSLPIASPKPLSSRHDAIETPEIRFEPREPLAPLQMQPLQIDEILNEPRVAAAVSADSIVHVHIGRIEVQRPAPPPPMKAKRQRGDGVLGLDEYFAQRTDSRRGRSQ